MSVQVIEIDGKQVAVLPVDEYRSLLEKAEMLEDVSAYDNAKAALVSGDDELVPTEVAESLLNGESTVICHKFSLLKRWIFPRRIWRKLKLASVKVGYLFTTRLLKHYQLI